MGGDMRQVLLFVHILLGIIWFGGIIFIGWGVFPASRALKPSVQREWLESLMKWVHWPLSLAGAGVIISGLLLGTVFGPLKTIGTILTTTYGQLFLIAFLTAVFTLLWGMFVGYRQTMATLVDLNLWQQAEAGRTKPLQKALLKTAAMESVEIIGLLIILACMVLI